jgi:sulfate adenylyltransferase
MSVLNLNRDQYLELENLALGVFDPLKGFMTSEEVKSVVETMRLPDGSPFPLPIVLDLSEEQNEAIKRSEEVDLYFEETHVGELILKDVFRIDKTELAGKVFGTDSSKHPGVEHLYKMGDYFAGGPVKLFKRVSSNDSSHELSPKETKSLFDKNGWKTIVGFQTRNIPHRGHEFLQRTALEHVDGLFIQPLVGRKKTGDFTPQAILKSYKTLISKFFRPDKVLLGVLLTSMRYAGPREAIFHAIIRRNFGCTHFIIGRDHAGVGNYYGKYDAHELSREFSGDLGIEIMRLCGPYYCLLCESVVTEKTCPHLEKASEAIQEINGTDIRNILVNKSDPDPRIIRPEIVQSLANLKIFVE